MKLQFAEARAAAAIAGGWFDDFTVFATAVRDQTHSWHVKEKRKTKIISGGARDGQRHTAVSYIAVGDAARSFCGRTNAYSTMPYKTGAKVVFRISQLATFFAEIDASASQNGVSIVDELAGGDATTENALEIAFDKLRPVTGAVTALHGLSDLGFLCHKPDIWMCRIASWCGWTAGYTPDDLRYNRRNGWQVLRNACIAIATEANRPQGAVRDLNPLRAFDWYIANFGMHFSPKKCPCEG